MPKGYSGTVGTQRISSLYPNVYRATFDAYFGGKVRPVDKQFTAIDQYDARAKIMRQYDVRRTLDGSFLEIEHVATLPPCDA